MGSSDGRAQASVVVVTTSTARVKDVWTSPRRAIPVTALVGFGSSPSTGSRSRRDLAVLDKLASSVIDLTKHATVNIAVGNYSLGNEMINKAIENLELMRGYIERGRQADAQRTGK